MRIKSINLSGFGRFQNFQQELDQNLTVVGGKNEAGKTTMINAIAAILFGFTGPRRDLHRRYTPWKDPKTFRASLMLETEDGAEYLVGRDFANGRTEVFRSEGIRMEIQDEKRLQELVQSEIGITNPNLFEHTFLIRENEVSLFEQDPRSRGGLSELIGRRMAGSGNVASIGEACRILEEQLRALTEGEETFPGGLQELRDQIETSRAQLNQEREKYFRSIQLEMELEKIEQEIQQLQSKIDPLKAALEQEASDNRAEAALEDVRQRIGRLSAEYDRLTKLKEEEEAQRSNGVTETPHLSDDDFQKLETAMNRLSAIEMEEKYRTEMFRDTQDSSSILEKEAQMLRDKLKLLGEWRSDPEMQAQISSLMIKANESQRSLQDLAKRVASSEVGLHFVGRLSILLGILFIVSGAGSAVGWIYKLVPLIAIYGIAGFGGASFLATLVSLLSRGHRKRTVARDKDELAIKENEYHLVQEELSKLLHGKSIDDYRRENELYRLYQNDLWHLENTLKQQQQVGAGSEENKVNRDESAELFYQIREILASFGEIPRSEWREILERERRLRILSEELEKAPVPAESWRESDLVALAQEIAMLREEESKYQQDLAENPVIKVNRGEISSLEAELHKILLDKAGKEAEYNLIPRDEAKDTWEIANTVAERELLLKNLTMEEEALRLAISLLKTAGEESADKMGPELERAAGEYLAIMTNGRYTRVMLDVTENDLAVKVMAPETGDWISPNMLSAGALDQVYLAFRIALAQVITKGARFPLFLDDPFQHFDRERLEGAVTLLKKIAENHQVIWWTKDLETAAALTGVEPVVLV